MYIYRDIYSRCHCSGKCAHLEITTALALDPEKIRRWQPLSTKTSCSISLVSSPMDRRDILSRRIAASKNDRMNHARR